jgi:hypothetical protein
MPTFRNSKGEIISVYEEVKTIVFIKCSINGQDKFFAFPINRRDFFEDVLDRIINPVRRKGSESITAYNFKYATFHLKTKGSRELTMAANPQYLISYSARRGFFYKSDPK